MNIRKELLKIAGKDNFELDDRIPTSYIIRICLKYSIMLVRGFFQSIGFHKISKSFFVGRKVKLYCKKLISIGSKTKLHDNVYIDALSVNGVKIGHNCVLGRNTRIECTGGLQCLGKGITIGNRTTFASDCYFGAAGGIEIGDDVVAGQYVRFHSENHNFSKLDVLIRDQGVTHQGIKIGNNCWIGAGAIFLDGAEVGDGCVIAANAVVTKKFESNIVIGGVPAKKIKVRQMNTEIGLEETDEIEN